MSYNELAEELFMLRTAEYEKGAGAKLEYVSTGENGVLYRLYAGGEESVLAGELARSMGLTSGRIANILKQLEAKDYVVRAAGTTDRRKVYVTLTESGRAFIEQAYADNIREIADRLSKLTEEEAAEYIRILGKLQED